MSHKHQHYVPLPYLRAWCDPKCPKDQSPYVWLTSIEDGKAKKKSPKKILRETDMYTIVGRKGERDISIEQSLSKVEGKFTRIRRAKLDKHLPLDPEERAVVCTFEAAMFARTKTYREEPSS